MAQQPIEPAQRPAERQPFVDVAEHDEALLRLAHHSINCLTCQRPLRGKEPEVRDDDAQLLPADVEKSTSSALPARGGHSRAPGAARRHFSASQQRVAITARHGAPA